MPLHENRSSLAMSFRASTPNWATLNVSLIATRVVAYVDCIGLVGRGVCNLVESPATIIVAIVAIDTCKSSGGQA
ncbi:hypothetical protein BJX96DRAFT_145685 [Aspergillus floccosus]